MDAPAKRIIGDNYEVVGVLGEGGTGVVYDAIRTSDQKPVALKVMHDALAGDAQIRGRFRREAAILRRLEGEHVCPILDFGEVVAEGSGASLLYIALPKIEGESLADVLAKEGPFDIGRTIDIVLEVLDALKSAHAQGVIHRDLKPANVLLEKGKKVVVVDFGMSKIVTGGIGTTNLTAHNMVFGTPEYMSPEQARGDDLDPRCDVYAVGIMLYEMLTGAPPFLGATPLRVLTAHLTSELELPSMRPSATGRITPALEAVVIHALARDRNARYPSASTLAAAIERARAVPNDVASVRPSAFSVSPRKDAFAETVPATVVGDLPVDATAQTLVNERPIVPSGRPSRGRGQPSLPPSSSKPGSVPSRRAPELAMGARSWIAIWVIVGLTSIAVGVYFALRP